jgi:hypothetical protein
MMLATKSYFFSSLSLSISSLRALEVENTTYSLSVVWVSQKQLINEIEVGLWPFTTRHLRVCLFVCLCL